MMHKTYTVLVEFKDPDFTHGMPEELAEKLEKLALWGDYWFFELVFDSKG